MATKVVKAANGTQGQTLEQVIAGLAQNQARLIIAADSTVEALVDNSTGAATGFTIPKRAEVSPADGSNLAQKAATEAAIGKVKNALATLYAKVNAIGALLGLEAVTYNGGGTAAGDGKTIAALDKAVAGAATGPALKDYEANRKAINGQFTCLHGLVNRLASVTGVQKLQDVSGETAESVAISGNVGNAASPGVTKAKVDADLTAWANNVAVLAAKLNAVLAVDGKPTILIVD